MWSRWISSSFWYQTWRNRLINNRVLIIWIKTGTFWKNANEAIQLYTGSDSWGDQYNWWMVTLFCNFLFHRVFVPMIRTQLFLNIFLQVWYQNEEDIPCSLWYAFNLHYMNHFWENWTSRSVQELFCCVYMVFQKL